MDSLKIILSSSLVKVTCQREIVFCLCLNLLKSSGNKKEENLQWKPESSSTARKKKKPKTQVSALCCYLDSSGTELILGGLYNLSVLSQGKSWPMLCLWFNFQTVQEFNEVTAPLVQVSVHQLTANIIISLRQQLVESALAELLFVKISLNLFFSNQNFFFRLNLRVLHFC